MIRPPPARRRRSSSSLLQTLAPSASAKRRQAAPRSPRRPADCGGICLLINVGRPDSGPDRVVQPRNPEAAQPLLQAGQDERRLRRTAVDEAGVELNEARPQQDAPP